jgi:perosamine synthetase
LIVIEDAAEAHGAGYKGRRAGSLARAAIFSFMGNKIITTGEGGMIVTDDAALAERCFFLQNHARNESNPYWHTEVGFNYRMTNLQAALGVAQLEQIDAFIAIRRRNAALYMDKLRHIPGLTMPPQADWAENVYWMFTALIEPEFGLSRDAVMRHLRDNDIESRPFFYPIHTMPMYNTGQSLPVAESLAARGINLPSGTNLTETQIETVCGVLGGLAAQ